MRTSVKNANLLATTHQPRRLKLSTGSTLLMQGLNFNKGNSYGGASSKDVKNLETINDNVAVFAIW